MDAWEQLIGRMKDKSREFARLTLDDRIRLAEQMLDGYHQVAEESVIAACQAKGIDPNSPLAGEEWLGGPMVTLRVLRQTLESLRELKKHGAIRIEKSWTFKLPDGRLGLKVYPTTRIDSTLLAGHTAEVHFRPGVTRENLRQHQASFYRQPHQGKLCVVLGAGNVNAIAPTDVIYKLLVEGTVCLLKMNPVNAYLGPLLERAFKAPIERGFLAVLQGGAEEGAWLTEHPLVDEVHITGSDHTYEQMVWGPPGPEREARKQRRDPVLKKQVSAELGNVTPVIVVPGPYSAGELNFQGKSIAGMVVNNASFNCNAAKLILTHQGWEGRPGLQAAIKRGLQRAQVRKAYYPGAEERWRRFTEGRPGLNLVGTAGPGELPYALIPELDPNDPQEPFFRQESWSAVFGLTALEAGDPAEYLARAVDFVNERVWGTLCVTLVVHPKTLADPKLKHAVEEAIRKLRYGAVCINTWPGAVFGLGTTPWGAHPSSTPENIQSGNGWVHNTLMLEEIEKVVLRAPVRTFPIPPWFPGHRTLDVLARKLTELEYAPGWLKIPAIAAAAMRG
ncbi:MAG: aldehyde dehydrogenase family protein [Myxococcota bacterium]|nr:aldehyde dehydrogenase family protein [Myxococcota bacterium]